MILAQVKLSLSERSEKGFTLLEMLLVLVLVAIISVWGVNYYLSTPNFSSYLTTQRITALLESSAQIARVSECSLHILLVNQGKDIHLSRKFASYCDPKDNQTRWEPITFRASEMKLEKALEVVFDEKGALDRDYLINFNHQQIKLLAPTGFIDIFSNIE